MKKDLLFSLLRRVPPGRVVSYQTLALVLGVSPRFVGRWLHQNSNSKIPCFRVVKKDGKLAGGYRFGGREGQKQRLLAEGVEFVAPWRVDKKAFFSFSLVFFDIDGTLFPTAEFRVQLWQFLAQRLGGKPADYAGFYRKFKESRWLEFGFKPGFGGFLQEKLGRKIEFGKLLDQFFYQGKKRFFSPSLKRLLGKLNKCCLLGIFSLGDVFTQMEKLRLLGVEKMFFPPLVLIDPQGKEKLAVRINKMAKSGLFEIWVVDNEDYSFLFSKFGIHFLKVSSVREIEVVVGRMLESVRNGNEGL